ncbi:MAG TPA: Y-family DNA polymerase [Verrucomicrobiae bacterium]|nr:Y-family DNA polymerase [Verrucomicrobiae bacterium]
MAQKVFALIDCNNFFASCERVFRPELATRPVIVLSNNDGCVVARSNEAKALGIPMAVPFFKIKDVVRTHGVAVFSGNFGLYGNMSQRVTAVLSAMAPNIEVYSIDESFVELSSLAGNDYAAWALQARAAVLQATGIPVSIGVAPSKTLAKAAATFAKKTEGTGGVHVAISEASREALLKWLPVEEVWGIGWRTAPKLQDIGVRSAYDITKLSDKFIQKSLTIKGLATAKELRGEAWSGLETSGKRKDTIMRSSQFGHAVRAYHQLESAVATFAARAAGALRRQDSICEGVAVYLRVRQPGEQRKYQYVRAVITAPEATADTGRIIAMSTEGLEQIYDAELGYDKAMVTLLGVGDAASWQLSLTSPDAQRERRVRLMRSVDALNKRYGAKTIWHATERPHLSDWKAQHKWRSSQYTTSWSQLPQLSV